MRKAAGERGKQWTQAGSSSSPLFDGLRVAPSARVNTSTVGLARKSKKRRSRVELGSRPRKLGDSRGWEELHPWLGSGSVSCPNGWTIEGRADGRALTSIGWLVTKLLLARSDEARE